MVKKELICIGCPIGCVLTVQMENDKISVTGNTCPRGVGYAQKEVTNPTRIVTTTVKVRGGSKHVVSVKTKQDIPKGKVFECIRELKMVEIQAPVYLGDTIFENVAGTGVDVVATKTVFS